MTPDDFVERWKKSGGAEMANSQLFLTELCDLLGVPHPDGTTTDTSANNYVFEKAVEFNNGDGTVSKGRVDLFKASCFVLESKQGSERKAAEAAEALATKTRTIKKLAGTAARGTPAWDRAMKAAYKQAKGYAEAIPNEWPPFLVVVDVGFCFDIYADFSGTGKSYVPFPDPRGYRVHLDRLRDERIRGLLTAIWTDPHSLDPSKISAKVTREIAERLAKLAKSLEADHEPEVVAGFLMRCLFTMFAEDVELLRPDSFTELLLSLRTEPQNFKPMAEALWESMDTGTFSTILREKVKQFNGKFFKDKTALPLNHDQVELLVEAAQYRWEEVEPAIFGTLLERALDPVERHKLGAHYTPRAYVERLVMPTVIEPLRQQWDATYAAASQLDEEGKRADARKLLREFHGQLCETRVLDPACGSGNFLYVAMELMKRLEGEVLNTLREFDEAVLPGLTIDPHQFLGIEVNPRAAALAELVLWIGSIQWYKRTRDTVNIPEPILKDYGNIECRDAVMAWDSIEPVVDDDGNPVTRWDGRTTKPHHVTGEEVPDEDARVQEVRYINPKKAEWPETDYIVGNPPFIGGWKLREAKGDGYVKAIWEVFEDIPPKADYVMFWWDMCGELACKRLIRRFGLITTNSIRQVFQRRVIEKFTLAKNPVHLLFAVPDHPWVDSESSAAVRIAMTIASPDQEPPLLASVDESGEIAEISVRSVDAINSNLTAGANTSLAVQLEANDKVSSPGVQLYGAGFILKQEESDRLLAQSKQNETVIHPYVNGKDLMQRSRDVMVIDFFGFDSKQARDQFPAVLQIVVDRVKPDRDQNRRPAIRDKWWRFGWERPVLRKALQDLPRFITTPETSKHRLFFFLSADVRPDNMLINIASDEPHVLGVLSSKIHVCWALAAGGRLGVGNDPRYNKTRCFETFPFPVTDDASRKRIGDLAEQLDAHRKRQQEQHPKLTMTGMYNVLEKLRAGETLTAKEKTIHEQGIVSVLKQIHDDLDAAVFDAYGWPHDLDDEAILQRLVDLNHERADEESRGMVRWLRPDFQNPDGATQTAFAGDGKTKRTKKATATKVKKQPWPKTLPDRMVAIQSALQQHAAPADAKEVAAYYTRANKSQVTELLETLAAVGNVRQLDDGRYVAAN